MKKLIVIFLLLISLAVLMLRISNLPIAKFMGISQKAGIRVISQPENADIFLDGVSIGETPYRDDNLEPKIYILEIKHQNGNWEGRVKLNSQTLTVVSRDLTKNGILGAGEILTLEKGSGVSIDSIPQKSDVEIDGKKVGKTPGTFLIESGEHLFVLGKSGFLKRSIRATIPSNYRLIISTDLSPQSLDLAIAPLSSDSALVTSTVIVAQTPTGFLRVRDKPSLAGREIARVSSGEELVLLEELTSWVKVRLKDGKEGYASNQYLQKKI